MADNLSSFKFTDLADRAISDTGWDLGLLGYDFVVVDTLAGNDTIAGSSDYVGISIGRGTINTGTGHDTVIGIGRDDSGNFGDGISNYGTINTAAGNDTIIGIGSGGDYGMVNNGTINTGAGNDTIRVSSIRYFVSLNNDGTINTGADKDIVNALKGGFGGDGKTYLGADNDKLMGFGTGKFYGGTGTDKILFGEGTYTISESTIVRGAAPMIIKSFEKIGGANGGIFDFRNGTLTVDSDGIATFA